MHFIIAKEVLVVESVKVSTFALVGELWRVADEVTSLVSPSVPVVTVCTLLVVNRVDEDVAVLMGVFKLLQTLDVRAVVIKSCSKDESFVSKVFAITEADLVVISGDFSCRDSNLNLAPVFNLCADTATIAFE